MTRVMIIEDEYSPRIMLREKLALHFSDLSVVGVCENAEEALIEVLRLRPNLIFLDIQMAGKNGLWLADELMRMSGETFVAPDIIFTTGYTYPEYLIKAFEIAAIDYLVKPVSVESLQKAVARYRQRSGTSTFGLHTLQEAIQHQNLLKFKSLNGIILLSPDDIVYIEADGEYAFLFLTNGTKEDVYERLGEIEKRLPQQSFFRTGKSVVLNRKYIRKISDKMLQLTTSNANYQVEISRSAIKELKEKMFS